MPPLPVDDVKRALRRVVRTERRSRTTHPEYDARRAGDAAAVAEALLAAFPGPGWVSVYQALPTEPPTAAYVAELHRRGARVLVPVVLDDLDLDWQELAPDGDLLPSRGRGALALAGLVVVPALSVDAQGHRLGQGGGSYDRALPRRAPGTPVVAVLHPQEYDVAPVPVRPLDVGVDAVVLTDGRVLRVSPTGPAPG